MKMSMILPCFFASTLLSSTLFAQSETAQTNKATAAAAVPRASDWAVITGERVYVRVAPDSQVAYPFVQCARGAIVRVISRENGWARVKTEGPTFVGATAFIVDDRRATIAPDGATLTIDARTELLAPDLQRKSDPEASWKAIASLDPGTTFRVIEVLQSHGKSFVKVPMPSTADGWISESFLRDANAEDVARAMQGAEAASNVQVADATNTTPDTTDTTTPATTTATTDASAPVAEPVDERFEPAAPSPEMLARTARQETFVELETMWKAVRDQPIASEELGALRARFEALSVEAAGEPTLATRAKSRTEQITLRMEVQERVIAVAALRSEMTREQEEFIAVARAIEARSDFSVVGVLNASTVYDGVRVPLLYRIQDPATGATLAYIQPQEGISADLLTTMLGTLVGLKGEVNFDSAFGVNLVIPRSIENLKPTDG
ncbi:MAG: hypothetical protein O2800_02800 [Planctomycetota bacterium]|nr:hypothetical protein [Planctomycetota bacterium]